MDYVHGLLEARIPPLIQGLLGSLLPGPLNASISVLGANSVPLVCSVSWLPGRLPKRAFKKSVSLPPLPHEQRTRCCSFNHDPNYITQKTKAKAQKKEMNFQTVTGYSFGTSGKEGAGEEINRALCLLNCANFHQNKSGVVTSVQNPSVVPYFLGH